MIFGTIRIYVRIHADSVRVRPPLPAVEYPVERLYLAFCGAFSIGTTIRLEMFVGTLRRL